MNGSADLLQRVRAELSTAVVGDVMDKMELQHQFLPPHLRPLRDDMVMIGRAMTVLEADVFTESSDGGSNEVLSRPFGVMLRALDDLNPGEIYVCTGGSPRYALWGELMSTRALELGAAGALVDGYHRDTRGILALGFPTFSAGAYAQDQGPRGKVIDFRVPLEIAAVRINPGDVVFGDLDGVCVIPRQSEEEVFARAFEKASREGLVERALRDGMGAEEAFGRFGVL
ncbi:MAG: RraA family protein [Actinomycetota bacterium]